MAMTLAQIRTHVRETVDLDSTELPDTWLDVLCREATTDIASRRRYWPHLQQAAWTFNTVANQHAYALATIEPASTDVAEVVAIIDTTAGGFSLDRVDHHAATKSWRNSMDVASTPRLWSLWAGEIHLWPKPPDIRTMSVRSYRKVKDWVAVGASEQPDLDERLHVAVPLYCLIRVYEQQEESGQAARYRELYETYVAKVTEEIMRLPEGPIILNGGLRGWDRWSQERWMQNVVDYG